MKRNKPDLILCSDLHLREDTPTCYIGDFQKEQWDALDFIKKLQQTYNCSVLCGGDFFHHWKPSPFLLSQTIEHLPDQFFTIYGQHDLPNHNLELSHKSGIYTLWRADKLGLLSFFANDRMPKLLQIEGCNWNGLPLNQDKDYANQKNILVWHVTTYKNDLPWPGCTASSAKRILKKYPQYSLILTGDNHQFFVEEYEGRLLVNPGSMTRQNADQLNHIPRVYLWYAETNTVESVYLPIAPGNEVISREHIEIIDQRNERIDAFVSKLETDWEATMSFEDNLKQFESTNQVRSSVMQIVYKSLEE
jgi:DNA repair exonuclease SbcCD nuclease subunit